VPGDSGLPSEVAQGELFTIVIAPFWGATDQAMEEGKVMQGLVERKVRDELAGEANVQVLSGVASDLPRSQEEATTLGEELDAAVVIWGEVFSLHGEVEIQPHLTLIRRSMVFWNPAGATSWNLSTPALEADLSQPSQLAIRKAKAEQVGNLVLMAAAYYYGGQDSEKAHAFLKRITPRSSTSVLVEALVEFDRDRRAEAESLCYVATALDALDPWPYYTLGTMQTLLQRYDEAIPNLERAFTLEPDQDDFRLQLAITLARKGDEKALDLYREVVERNPENSGVHVKLGWLYSWLLRRDEAIGEHKLAIRLDPGNLYAYRGLGFAYEFNDSLSDAAESYKRAKQLATSTEDRATMSWFLARVLLSQGKYEEALAEFHNAIALRPEDAIYYFLLERAYVNLEKGEEGLKIIREAVEAHPGDSQFLEILGSAYLSLHMPDKAAAVYRDALRLNPNTGDAHHGMGMAYSQMDSLALAVASYQEAKRLGILYYGGYRLHSAVASVYLAQGLCEDAAVELSEAIRLEPNLGDPHVELAVAYICLGRFDEAVAKLRTATELHSDFVYFKLFYALSLHRVGRAEEGRGFLRNLAGTLKDDSWEASLVRFLAGELDEMALLSLADSEDSTLDREHKCEAYYYAGMAYLLDTGARLESAFPDTARAKAYLEQCIDTGVREFYEYTFARVELARLQNK
jgi:tetratricopeptide (TPR) repeat protein